MEKARPSPLDAVVAVGSLLATLGLLAASGLPLTYHITLDGMRVVGWHQGPVIVFAAAVFTPLFLLLRRKSLRRAAWPVRAALRVAIVLFVGKSLVLIAVGLLAYLGVTGPQGTVDQRGLLLSPPTDSETWWLDGKAVAVHTTYYERVGDLLIFRIEVPHEGAAELTEQEAGALAWPILRHAWRKNLFERSPGSVDHVVVALFEKVGFVARGRHGRASMAQFPELISSEDEAVWEAQGVATQAFNSVTRGDFDGAYDRTSSLFRGKTTREGFCESFERVHEALGARFSVRRPPLSIVYPGRVRIVFATEYENGPAFVRCDLHRDGDEWRVLSLVIESPIFKELPEAPDADPAPGTRIEPERFVGRWHHDSIELLIRDDSTYRWTNKDLFQTAVREGPWVSGERRILLYFDGFQDSMRFDRGTLFDEMAQLTYTRSQ
jgi:hypothetical protein